MTKPMTLEEVAQAMVAPGKGILAADESSGTIKKRFDSIKAESTADSRRDYREMMFRCTQTMRSHISGVILYDETIRQKAKDDAAAQDHRGRRLFARHQGRRRHRAAAVLPRPRSSPKASTACATASRTMSVSAPSSPSGAR